MLGDEGHVALTHVTRHHALALGAGAAVLDALPHHVMRNSQGHGQTLHHIGVVDHVRIGKNGQARPVSYQGLAVSVADMPPGGWGGYRRVAVVVGLRGIAASVEHLHAECLKAQRREHCAGEDAHALEAIVKTLGRGVGAYLVGGVNPMGVASRGSP